MKQTSTLFRAIIAAGTLLCLGRAPEAQAAERDTPRTPWTEAVLTAAETIRAGEVVGQTGGLAYRYVDGSTNLVVGVAHNSAASNTPVRVRAGLYGLDNAGDITAAHTAAMAYAGTNNTARTAAASGSSPIGRIVAVYPRYVWVRIGP
ncbi:MAG: hypothetical protein GX174_14760 [Lentisphaerae bacterium]|nr:hypothetical protein [Lentisphaerota bacterium]